MIFLPFFFYGLSSFAIFTPFLIGGDKMEKVFKALGKVLVYATYVIVVLVILGIIQWIVKALTHKAD